MGVSNIPVKQAGFPTSSEHHMIVDLSNSLWSLAQDHRPLCLSLLHTVCYTSLSPLWLTQVQMTVGFFTFRLSVKASV